MRRGFKTEAERMGVEIREALGLRVVDALPLGRAATHFGAELRSAGDLVDITRLEEIEQLQPGAFSACTFEIADRRVIVWNPLSSRERRSSDIAHELAHICLEHKVQEVKTIGDLTFFGCNPEEEQEANWLAGCLLLPRKLLEAELRARATASTIAAKYGVSLQMTNYRLRATGVERQFARR